MTREEAKSKAIELRDAEFDLQLEIQLARRNNNRIIEFLRRKIMMLEQDLYEWDIEDLLKDEDDETIPTPTVPAA